MQDYTLSLALFDFVPVALSATGLTLLVRMLRQQALVNWPKPAVVAAIGASLVVLGGLLKASWKLLWVTTHVDHSWMSAGLFWCLGPGFVLLAGASLSLVRKPTSAAARTWLIPLVVAMSGVLLAIFLPDSKKLILLLMTVLGNLFMMGCLITCSSRRKLHHASALYVLSIIATFTLSGLARIPEQTAALQWIEEWTNFGGQGLFALATFILWRHNYNKTLEKPVNE